jgi:hypothetical protein
LNNLAAAYAGIHQKAGLVMFNIKAVSGTARRKRTGFH